MFPDRMSADTPFSPSHFVRVEAEALRQLADRLDGEMHPALEYALALLARLGRLEPAM